MYFVDAALLELPWYTELDAIWHSNPSMAAKTHSSRPGIDHAGALYSLVGPHAGAGPPMQLDTSASPPSTLNRLLKYIPRTISILPALHPRITASTTIPQQCLMLGVHTVIPPSIQHCNILLLLPHYPLLPLCPLLALCPPLPPYPPLPPTISPPKSISLAFQHQTTTWTWTWTFKAPVAHWMPPSKVTRRPITLPKPLGRSDNFRRRLPLPTFPLFPLFPTLLNLSTCHQHPHRLSTTAARRLA